MLAVYANLDNLWSGLSAHLIDENSRTGTEDLQNTINMKLIRVVFVLILIMEDIAIKKIKSVRCGYEFFTYNQKQNWLNIIIFYIRNVI